MKKLEEKIRTLLEERETIHSELTEIQKAITIRQDRLLEINGGIKVLQTLINESKTEKETAKSVDEVKN